MPTALVIDGAYFLRRFRWSFPGLDATDPQAIAHAVRWMSFWHLHFRMRPKLLERSKDHAHFDPAEGEDLYRIFFYDCPPLLKKVHTPIGHRAIDLSKTPVAQLRINIHRELKGVRKLALRLGRLDQSAEWRLKPASLQQLISTPSQPLVDEDFEIDTKQKGVDMKLGLDVASLAFKRQVDQIVLVAGDADFVPATKLARREGIDVVLDPMGGTPAADLIDHVDGIRQCRMGEEHQ